MLANQVITNHLKRTSIMRTKPLVIVMMMVILFTWIIITPSNIVYIASMTIETCNPHANANSQIHADYSASIGADVINLNGQTITLSDVLVAYDNNGYNGLPAIISDKCKLDELKVHDVYKTI